MSQTPTGRNSPLRPRQHQGRQQQHLHEPSPSRRERPSEEQSSLATSMTIPKTQRPAPPPLPPPPYIPELSSGQDLGWRWGNDSSSSDFGRPASVKPGSSLLGAAWREGKQRKESDAVAPGDRVLVRRGSSTSTVTPGRESEMESMNAGDARMQDETFAPTTTSSYGLQSERQLGQRSLEASSKSYDTHLLSRIGGPNANRQTSLSGLSGDTPATPLSSAEHERRNITLRPLTVPGDRRQASVDSLSGWQLPSSGSTSPGFAGHWPDPGVSDSRWASHSSQSYPHDEGRSHRGGSYGDSAMFVHDAFGPGQGQIGALNIHDRSPRLPKAGSKRRASSPPREIEERSSVSSASGHSDLQQLRSAPQPATRGSPVSRYHPNHSSLSSASSLGPRQGSFGSSLGIASIPSSATSYGSGPISPGALSPAAEQDVRHMFPYTVSRMVNPAPLPEHHQRTLSESMHSSGSRKLSVETTSHARHSSFSHTHGRFVCECCPKKPKKFDTEEALRSHELEKQYTCAYCPNRFKNKNEAERHQNSLHLRRQSWSCAVLYDPRRAFHPSTSSSDNDVCGYCGMEFPNPPHWISRAEHLSNVHKFRECNPVKKFFRADHFRQHLKHSHQGTSGKWTNTLENACMQEESLEKPTNLPGPSASSSQPPTPALVITPTTPSGSGRESHGPPSHH